LPTTFVGEHRIVGFRALPALKEAYEAAATQDGGRGAEIPLWAFWSAVALGVVVIGALGRETANGLANG
jgi:hypothetical protein